MNPSKPKPQELTAIGPLAEARGPEVEAQQPGCPDCAPCVPKPMEYALILGVRRIKTGSFAGLWELAELSGDHSVKRVITDANTRSIVISLAAREIGKAQ